MEPEFLVDDLLEERTDKINEVLSLIKDKEAYSPQAKFLRKFVYAIHHTINIKKEAPYLKPIEPFQRIQPSQHTEFQKMLDATKLKPQLNEIPSKITPPFSLEPIENLSFEESMQPIKEPESIDEIPAPTPTPRIENLTLTNNNIFIINEPVLSTDALLVYDKIKSAFANKLQKNPALIDEPDTLNKMRSIAKKMKLTITNDDLENISYYLQRDIIGFGKIDPLLKDQEVKSIYGKGINKPIIIDHLKKGQIATDIVYKNDKELNDLIKKFASKSNKTINEKNPVLDTILPSGVRVQATLGNAFVSSKFVIKRE